MKDVNFSDLIDIQVLQMIQDSFSKYTGLVLCVFNSDGVPVVNASGNTDFCDMHKKCTEEGARRCSECLRNGILKAGSTCGAVTYNCHMGLVNSVIPIVFQDRIFGNIAVYSIRTEESDEEKVRAFARGCGIDEDEYAEAFHRIKYMPKAEFDKNTHFLFEFAKALSVMAYDNYQKLSESRKTERDAKSQADFITGLTEELHESMRNWLDDFSAVSGKYMDIPEIADVSDKIIAEGQEVYAVIGGAVDYIRLSGGKNEYSENIYDIRKLVDRAVELLRKDSEKEGIVFKTSYDESVPETLIGNSGRIGELLNKLGQSSIKFTNRGGTVRIEVSCARTRYSCNLNIRINNESSRVTADMVEDIRKYLRSGSSNIFSGVDDISGMDFRLILMLVHQMSGKLALEGLEDGRIILLLVIPQLDGAKRTYIGGD